MFLLKTPKSVNLGDPYFYLKQVSILDIFVKNYKF